MTPDLITLDSIIICDEEHDQQAPTVSYGDSIFLVSWLDKRGVYPAIYSARVALDGTVIERNGFMLHADSMNQIAPVSAYDGSNFMVVWVGFDPGGFGVYAKRVSPSGAVVDSVPIQLCYDPAPKYNPSVCFDGTNYMVIWDDARINGSEYDEWCARISTGGVVLDTDGIPVDTSPGFQLMPSIAYVAPYFLAVWTDEQSGEAELVGKRITSNGSVIEQTAIPISSAAGAQLEASLYPGYQHYFVTWEDTRCGYANKNIYGEFVDSAGTGIPGDVASPEVGREGILTVRPNPFYRQVTVQYGGGDGTSRLKAEIFDVCGRMVKEGFMRSRGKGYPHTFLWDGRDNRGLEVAAGIYCIVLSDGTVRQKKMLLLLK